MSPLQTFFLPQSSNLGKLAQINGDCFALKGLIAGVKDNFSLVRAIDMKVSDADVSDGS